MIVIDDVEREQSNLLENMVEFKNKSKAKQKKVRIKKETLLIV